MKLLISFIANAISLLVVTYIVPGVTINDLRTLAIAAIIVGLVNTFIRPIIKLVSLPITLMTFGLFAIVINAAMFGLAAWLIPGFEVDGIIPAFLGAIVMSIASIIIDYLIKGLTKTPTPPAI